MSGRMLMLLLGAALLLGACGGPHPNVQYPFSPYQTCDAGPCRLGGY